MILGANHFTISVKDLQKAFHFYRDVLGFRPLMKHSRGAYFLAGELWFCLDVADQESRKSESDYTHLAFSVESEHFQTVVEKIKSSGATIWKENVSEGQSLYFLDPDGHRFEIHVGNWKTRLQSAKEKPWGENVEFFE
jgi:catechol 2,3-dioxygenase-like lactoylglutathione lyase family enzyme